MEKLYVIIPCYNEEEVLFETKGRIRIKMMDLIKGKKISKGSKVLFVNDGSSDNTWDLICSFYEEDELFVGINLSRNYGHQNALVAGMMTVMDEADIIISMDADLQDDIDAIDEMLIKRNNGNEIVYGVRKSREKDSFFKRVTAEFYYKFLSFIGVNIIYNHADYRLVSKRVLQEFKNYKEINLFLRGIFPLIGFKSDIVYYERKERVAGKTKYPLKRMVALAWDGISSFSVKPVRIVLLLGALILFISILMISYSIFMKIIGNTVEGWTFIVCSLWLLGGIQMLSLGIIGEYIGKIYSEVKGRPKFIVQDYLRR